MQQPLDRVKDGEEGLSPSSVNRGGCGVDFVLPHQADGRLRVEII